MGALNILGISLGLAMDAFAVSIAVSVMLRHVTGRQVFRLAFHFGLFQALMPVVGWAAGLTVEPWIAAWDHWVAFGLLAFVGGKALWSGIRGGAEERRRADPTKGVSLIVLSVATSLDALAVGLSFAALRVNLVVPVLSIGLVAAGMTTLGMFAGPRLGMRFGRGAEILGGAVLLGIGLKILAEHFI